MEKIVKRNKLMFVFLMFLSLVVIPAIAFASHGSGIAPSLFGIRIEFFLFGLTLLGVALFHDHTLKVAVSGLIAILLFKLLFAEGFNLWHHLFGEKNFLDQVVDKHAREGEWPILLNLFGLLVGFAILAKQFEDSGVPDVLPNFLPDDWKGPFVLLVFVFIMSSFLDNIAAAMIGGTIALVVFQRKVHIGYIAAIVAASNAGGAGSVVGDTTTTMMWIDGVSALHVLHAYIAAIFAFLFFAGIASFQQDKYNRIIKDAPENVKIDYNKLLTVALILVGTITTNVLFDFPALGVWIAILLSQLFTKTPWQEAKHAIPGSFFLLSLVMCASMMPVEELPPASWQTAFGLGFLSSVFDNIPLTKLALDQGCYDWGVLAYTVGFGGSMVWFGSSAGVAITNKFPEGRNVFAWIKKGWHVIVGYIIGFIAILFIWGFEPEDSGRVKVKEKCQCVEEIGVHHHNPDTKIEQKY